MSRGAVRPRCRGALVFDFVMGTPRRTPWNGGTTIKSSVDQMRTRGGFSSIVVSLTEVHRITEIKIVRKPAIKNNQKHFSSKRTTQLTRCSPADGS